MSALLANADIINRIRNELFSLMSLEGAPALSAEQVDQLVETIRSTAQLPPFPWTEDVIRGG